MPKQTDAQRNLQYVNTKQGRFRSLVRGAKASANKRGQVFALTYEDICLLWIEQKGKCAYTGWDMDTITGSNTVVSIERIDNTLGYLTGNCILVCWCANRARSTLDFTFFKEMCKAISNKKDILKKDKE